MYNKFTVDYKEDITNMNSVERLFQQIRVVLNESETYVEDGYTCICDRPLYVAAKKIMDGEEEVGLDYKLRCGDFHNPIRLEGVYYYPLVEKIDVDGTIIAYGGHEMTEFEAQEYIKQYYRINTELCFARNNAGLNILNNKYNQCMSKLENTLESSEHGSKIIIK